MIGGKYGVEATGVDFEEVVNAADCLEAEDHGDETADQER